MIDATVGQRRRTINLLGQTPDQGDFDRLEDGQVILRQRDDKSLEGDAGRDKAPSRAQIVLEFGNSAKDESANDACTRLIKNAALTYSPQ